MSTLRRRAATAALLALVPLLGACGFHDQTDAVYQSATGVESRTGQMWILNALIVSDKDGTGTFAGTLVNQSQTRSGELVSVTDADGSVAIKVPASGLVNLADSGTLRLTDPRITPGAFVPLTFQFSNGQTVKIGVPVVAHGGDYAKVPVGTPSSSPTSSASAKPSARPSATASASASPSSAG